MHIAEDSITLQLKQMVKIFIGGFPLQTDELAIVQLFAPFGDVSTIKIVRDRATGICKGYAFVEMLELAEAQNAIIALDGTEMGDRELKVNLVEEKQAPPAYKRVVRNNNFAPEKAKRPRRRI
jgi:RNA recognition motif-containing protein